MDARFRATGPPRGRETRRGNPIVCDTQRDAPAGAAKSALLSHALWMEALGERPV